MKIRDYKFDYAILFAAILIALCSVVGDLFSDNYSWFARSGSIVVLLAIIVEFRVSTHVYDDIQRAQFLSKKIDLSMPLKAKPSKQKKRISCVAHSMVIIGTIIWGYGDLIWPQR